MSYATQYPSQYNYNPQYTQYPSYEYAQPYAPDPSYTPQSSTPFIPTTSDKPQRTQRWNPTFFTALPWTGLLSLIGVILTAVAAFVVLHLSDHQEPSKWPSTNFTVSPTVLLAIIAVISNILLRYALSEAWTIIWWRRVLRPLKVKELHENWAYFYSVLDALGSGRRFNVVALGKIVVTFAVVQGPLLQRTSRTVLVETVRPAEVRLGVPDRFLSLGFTGYTFGRATGIHGFTSRFIPAVRRFNNRESIFVNYTGCAPSSTCKLVSLVAPGFDISCTSDTLPWSINMSSGGSNSTLFTTSITYGSQRDPHNINITGLYKPPLPSPTGTWTVINGKNSSLVSGTLLRTQCVLRDGLVNYNATLRNGTIELDPYPLSTPQNSTLRLLYAGKDSSGIGNHPSTIGGIYLAAYKRYQSKGYVLVNGSPLLLDIDGTAGFEYLATNDSTFNGVNVGWNDPVPDMIAGVRELMFRAALEDNYKNATDIKIQTVQASESGVITEYQSDFRFLGAALAVPILAAVVVAGMMWGWWELGRKVGMGPVEIGKAMGARVLDGAGSNEEVKGLWKQVGGGRVVYGDAGKGRLEIVEVGGGGEVVRPRKGGVYS